VRFALLGPLTGLDDSGNRVTLAGPRQRVLLAALLLRANSPVPASVLGEEVWDEAPPAGAAASLRRRQRRVTEQPIRLPRSLTCPLDREHDTVCSHYRQRPSV
jgi:hypothetical protein